MYLARWEREDYLAPHILKTTLDKLFPSLMDLRRSYNLRKSNKQIFDARQRIARKKIFGDSQIQILTGPFAGMSYIDERVWGPIEPRWLGTYEAELHSVVGEINASNYRTILDVGSAEGYYAVGLARANPRATVYSYEVDPWSRAQQKRLCTLNGVKNLRLMGRCTHQEINSRAEGHVLLICDIEGFERELLNPSRAVGLKKIDLLVEVHRIGREVSMGAMERLLRDRFSGTHQIEALTARPRTQGDASKLPGDIDLDYLNEWREDNQVWLWMRSNEKTG